MTVTTTSGFRTEFEIEVDGIVYGATATGKVESVHEGDDLDSPLVLVRQELVDLDLDVYDEDGETASESVYYGASDYVYDNFEGWI